MLFQTKLILTTDECLGYHMLDSVNFDTLVWFLPIFKWSWDQINLFYNLKAIFTLRRASLWFFSFTSLQSKSKLQLTAKGNCFLHFLFVWKRLGKRSEERLWLKRRKKKRIILLLATFSWNLYLLETCCLRMLLRSDNYLLDQKWGQCWVGDFPEAFVPIQTFSCHLY